jgi:predicted RNA methylase
MPATPRQSMYRAMSDTPGAALATTDIMSGESDAGFDWAWYEAQLAPQERRQRGHYSTPPNLVARMLQWVGYAAGADLEHVTLLDPACGSGNFLAAAAQTLIAHGQARQWSQKRIQAALQANLWGLESDPVACTLAGLRLQALARRLAPRKQMQFHIHQADALSLAAAPRFRVVVGNPPYLSSRKHDLRAYEQGYLSGGQRDAYLLFLEQVCRFVAPNGWLGLVLPDPVLARANAADARKLLQDLFRIHRLLHLKGVFRAEVGTLVLIAQRVLSPASLVIPASRFDWRHAAQEADPPAHMFPIDIWKRQPQAELRYLLGPEEAKLFERLACEAPAVPLGDLVTISRGEEMARGAARRLTEEERSDDYLPVLRGGLDVRPFRCHFAGVYLHRNHVIKPPERYRQPKLLVVKSTAQLCAALDEQGHVAFQTLYLLHLKSDQILPEYLLALLNSRLLRGYLWLYHTAYKLVQPQIEQEALARVPLPLVSLAEQQEPATLAGQLRAWYQEYDQCKPSGKTNSAAGVACANEAAWIQLQQRIRDLAARLDSVIATLCGLTPAEQALLERVPLR